jgi:hypothetical protein
MTEQTNPSYDGRTLVVILSMHRSGSSVVTHLLQRLGMSLGPFELLGATEYNKYGHFEAKPTYDLDRELLAQIFDFNYDIPDSPEVLRRFCECEGQWKLDTSTVSQEQIEHGRKLVRQLVDSGPISGFKDPRVPLLWPFWNRVFSTMADLRVVPIFLARSPHEIAMSIFRRGKGALAYHDALDVAAVHYLRLNDLRDGWKGDQAVVRFDPRVFREDMRRAAEVCNLAWSEEAFAEVYDASCRHYEPAPVVHPAEALFRRLSRLEMSGADPVNLERLERDAETRESVLRDNLAASHQKIERLTLLAKRYRREWKKSAARCDKYDRTKLLVKLACLEQELAQIQASRTWRCRKHIVRIPPVKWLTDATL